MTDHHPCAQLFTCAKYYVKLSSEDNSNTTYCVIALMFTAFSGEAFLNDHLLSLWENPKARKKLVGVAIKEWDKIEKRGPNQKYDMLVDYFEAVDSNEKENIGKLFKLRNTLAHPKVTAAALVEGSTFEIEDPFKKEFTFEIVNRHFQEMTKFMGRLDKLAGRKMATNIFVSGLRA